MVNCKLLIIFREQDSLKKLLYINSCSDFQPKSNFLNLIRACKNNKERTKIEINTGFLEKTASVQRPKKLCIPHPNLMEIN
jgi:hypothetical protein